MRPECEERVCLKLAARCRRRLGTRQAQGPLSFLKLVVEMAPTQATGHCPGALGVEQLTLAQESSCSNRPEIGGPATGPGGSPPKAGVAAFHVYHAYLKLGGHSFQDRTGHGISECDEASNTRFPGCTSLLQRHLCHCHCACCLGPKPQFT